MTDPDIAPSTLDPDAVTSAAAAAVVTTTTTVVTQDKPEKGPCNCPETKGNTVAPANDLLLFFLGLWLGKR